MATITIQTYSEAGIDPTYTAAAGGGDQFANTGKEIILIKNADATSKTVTITAQTTSGTSPLGAVTKSDASIAVAAGSTAIIGPFPKPAFNDSNNFAQITYSAVTSLSIAVMRQGS